MITSNGKNLSCVEKALRSWPPDFINRCPVEKFGALVGQNVVVLDDGKYIYDVEYNGKKILSYRVFVRFRNVMILLSLLMFSMSLGVLMKKGTN